ncbi:hypothetical protein GQ53DRAFT_753754 [Thozetella sp. PMI_491]|nr:hypothetical protein GQ53DRAFT_753754 [Thozetella sp. PMI_491]
MSSPASSKKATRTKGGCLTCRRQAKVKCDQQHPVCVRCTRLGLHCKWEEKHITLKERRRQEAERWAAAPPNIRPAAKTRDPALAFHGAGEGLEGALGPMVLELEVQHATNPTDYLLGDGLGTELTESLFDSMSTSFTDDLDSFLFLSPTTDMVLGTESMYASLPSLVGLTKTDHHALDYFQKEIIFGFGSKSPAWSTHAILLQSGAKQPMVLHLLLAASMTELGWQNPSLGEMTKGAEKHYRLGRDMLAQTLSSPGELDHLAVIASFWFLFLHQRRGSQKQSLAYRQLSEMMRGHVQTHRLDRLLSLGEQAGAGSPSCELVSPQRTSLLARLISWLFWIDAQSCFQGEGGSLARLLLGSSPSPSYQSIFDIYDRSRATLELHWGEAYPDSELADDLKNGGALELIHRTWVIVQEINDATDFGGLDPAKSREMGARLDALRTRFPFSSVFRLADSPATKRDRLMANSDWAVCNYYAVRIYHYRCGIGASGDDEAVAHVPEPDTISETVAALLILIQKTLAACEKGQIDRLQWPLFWAGIETSDPIYREWILMKLTNPGLQAALEIALLEQAGVGRISIGRIRRICREKCTGELDSGSEWVLPT